MRNFVSGEWVKENRENVVIIDARFDMHSPEWGATSYKESHISGAYYLHLNIDLAGVKSADGKGGGRPLPRLSDFKKSIENMGISKDKTVVIYDHNMLSGSRGVLVFKYFGVENVKLVDGGMKALIEAGLTCDNIIPEVVLSTIELEESVDMTRDIDYIKSILSDDRIVLVENRSLDRYLGIVEPMYPKKGHIPGAKCIPSESVLNKSGRLVGIDELKRIFSPLKEKKEIIFYCGSGVNAALVFLAHNEIEGVAKVYIGGFSEWIASESNRIETKNEN